jgi:poly(3-hydroxybutyrate) depolymerase
MRTSTISCLLLCLLIGTSVAKLPTYNIDPKSLTTGGLSSGAFMAVQVHFAFSKTIKGAAITAGGPFWCAQG